MFPPAILDCADRLIATLMTLVDAISPIACYASTPTFPVQAAQALFFRLARLVTTLIRISAFGPPRARSANPGTRTRAASRSAAPVHHLPSRPGWLLAALPDLAPAIAADLTNLLADPALAHLLAASPAAQRTLRPLLRSLGLTQPPPPTPAPPPRNAHPEPTPFSNPGRPAPKSKPPRQTGPDSKAFLHAPFITI